MIAVLRARDGLVLLSMIMSWSCTSANIRPIDDTVRLSGEEVLAATMASYQSLASYRDAGVATTRFMLPDAATALNSSDSFRTVFVPPDRLRFEAVSKDDEGRDRTYVLWHAGSRTLTQWDLRPGVEEHESLLRALGGAAGATNAAARLALPLLLGKDTMNWWITPAQEGVERLDDDNLDGVPCYRLQGGRGTARTTTVWIEKATCMVRRATVVVDGVLGGLTITCDPIMNGPVEDADLAFVLRLQPP